MKATVFPSPTFLSENNPVDESVTTSPVTKPVLTTEDKSTEAVMSPSYTLSPAVIPVIESAFGGYRGQTGRLPADYVIARVGSYKLIIDAH